MIDEYNDDRTGFARFSDDMVMRFHLARAVSDAARRDTDVLPALAELATSGRVDSTTYEKFGVNADGRAQGITCGTGSHSKPGGVIGAPYLDGVQHLAFPEVRRG